MDLIYKEINAERERQVSKWGVQNHKPIEWLSILMEEIGEAASDAHEAHFAGRYYSVDKIEKLRRYRAELIQVAAVAVAMIESVDRNELH